MASREVSLCKRRERVAAALTDGYRKLRGLFGAHSPETKSHVRAKPLIFLPAIYFIKLLTLHKVIHLAF